LADPGDGIPADKGQACATFLSSQGWSAHNGILIDDSPTNIATAQGKVDWLQVTPREGIASDALQFLSQRARMGNRPKKSPVASKRRIKAAETKAKATGKTTKGISILVTSTSAYCGGAAPTEFILKQLQLAQPIANFTLLFYRADAKLQKRRGQPQSATSDDNGLVQMNLKPLPAGLVYCVVSEAKAGNLVVPPDNEYNKYDKQCLQKQHSTCDLILTSDNTTAKVNFPSYCSWGTPCIHFTGPLPP